MLLSYIRVKQKKSVGNIMKNTLKGKNVSNVGTMRLGNLLNKFSLIVIQRWSGIFNK